MGRHVPVREFRRALCARSVPFGRNSKLYYRLCSGKLKDGVPFEEVSEASTSVGRAPADGRTGAIARRLNAVGIALNVDAELKNILGEILGLDDRASRLTDQTELLGSLPELDSMAVVTVITTIEERFGIVIGDDEISADTFGTFGSLRRFVEEKVEE